MFSRPTPFHTGANGMLGDPFIDVPMTEEDAGHPRIRLEPSPEPAPATGDAEVLFRLRLLQHHVDQLRADAALTQLLCRSILSRVNTPWWVRLWTTVRGWF